MPVEGAAELAALFEAALSRAEAGRIALIDSAGRWTYAELDGISARLAGELGPGDGAVVVAAPRSAAAVAGLVACVRAGRPFVPASPALAPDRARALLDGTGARDLVTTGPPPAWWTGGRVHHVPTAPEYAATEPHGGAVRPGPVLSGHATGYFLATSGTTGRPKLVRGAARALARYLRWQRDELRITAGDVLSNTADPWFDFSFKETLAAVTAGATVAVVPDPALAGGAGLLGWLAEHRPTVVCLLPSRLAALTGALEKAPAERAEAALARLRLLLVSGEPFPAPLFDRWRRVAPRATVLNLYGPTESTVIKLRHVLPPGAAVTTETVPVGHPLPGTQVLIGEGPDDGSGELSLLSPDLALGYVHGTTGSTMGSTRFATARGAAGASPDGGERLDGTAPRLLHTGDLARRTADGAIELVGRGDDVVKRDGVKISLPGLEAAARSCPAVDTAAAVRVPAGADGRERIVLFFTARTAPAPEARRALRGHLLGRLGPSAMPDTVHVLDTLPLDARGKIDRRALRAGAAARRAGA